MLWESPKGSVGVRAYIILLASASMPLRQGVADIANACCVAAAHAKACCNGGSWAGADAANGGGEGCFGIGASACTEGYGGEAISCFWRGLG